MDCTVDVGFTLGTTAVTSLRVAEPAHGKVETWFVYHASGIGPTPNTVYSFYLDALESVV